MKKHELQGLIRRVSERHPGLVHADRVLYEAPVNSILRGIVFSTFIRSPRQLQVASFARPLFVPSAGPLIGQFCRPIRRGVFSLRDVWIIDEFDQESKFDALVAQIGRRLPSLERLKTPYLFATNAMAVFGRANRDRTDFAIGLSFLKDAHLVSGENVLRRIAHRDASRAVRKELMERVQEVLARIGSNDVDELLGTWECETIAQLRSYGVILDDNLASSCKS